MKFWRWFRQRLTHLKNVAVNDPTAFTELLAGLLLVVLRGVLLLFVPEHYWPAPLQEQLDGLGINESRWGMLLMTLGLAQMLLAGSPHYVWRLVTIGAITFAAILVALAYLSTSPPNPTPTMLGVTCVTTFYLALFIRILMDRDRQHGR